MSVRLNVVVVQSPRMTSLQVGVVADIVIQLLGRPGIDVAMVTSLQPDEDHSTDRLMLSGIENDLAIVDWRPAQEIVASLEALGINACQAPHSLDTDVQPIAPGRRRAYVFDLRNGFKANDVVIAIIKILAQRQVVTVSLLAPKQNGTASVGPQNGQSVATKLEATKSPTQTKVDLPSHVQIVPPESPASMSVDDAELDALVDCLNDSDL